MKPMTVVTVPSRPELKEWSGQPGVVISRFKQSEAVVLVASNVSETRAARFIFPVSELKEGSEASDYLLKAAADHLKNHEEYIEFKSELKAEEALVLDYLDKLERLGVRFGSASDTRELWIDYGTYGNTIYYTTILWKGEEIARVPRSNTFGYGNILRKAYERVLNEKQKGGAAK